MTTAPRSGGTERNLTTPKRCCKTLCSGAATARMRATGGLIQFDKRQRVIARALAAALIDAMTCHQELRRLEAFQLATFPVSSWQEFGPEDWRKAATWLAQARAAGLDV